jgi:RNA polymerase sigma factor (sigma-70 family)
VENNRNFILVLFKGICNNDQKSFNTLFQLYYKRLLNWGIGYVNNKQAAEEIVSDVFIKLWHNRAQLDNIENPEVYLFTAVRNNALNYLKTFSRSKVVYMETLPKEAFLYLDDPEKELEL